MAPAQPPSDKSRLMDKLRALLAKTTEAGCTEAEAMSALAKVGELMSVYNITHLDLATNAEPVDFDDRTPSDRIRDGLSVATAKFCTCRVWVSKRTGSPRVVFAGLTSDVEFAKWLIEALAAFVERQRDNFVADSALDTDSNGESLRADHRGFEHGCVQRISQRLFELSRALTGPVGVNALVPTKFALIDGEMAMRGISLHRRSSSAGRGSASGIDAGRSAGDRATFNRPVGGGASGPKLIGRS